MSSEAWRALAFVLVLGVGASGLAALLLHPGRRSRVEAQILAATLLGGIPAVAIFTVAWWLPGGGYVAGVAFGCVVGGALGTAGAWAVRGPGDGCRRPVLAFVGTLAGATVGSAIGAGVVFATIMADGQLPPVLMFPLAAAYVGSSAALGFQVGGG